MYSTDNNVQDSTNSTDSLVDLIQTTSSPVTTVAEAKNKKAVRQISLDTIHSQLSGFSTEEIINYPISTILGLETQVNRIVEAYKQEIKKLDA